MKRFRYLLVFGIIALDQLLKLWVRQSMYIGESHPVIQGIFHLTYVQNRGAAFSIFSGQGILLVVVPLIAIAVAVWYMEKHMKDHWTLLVALTLIISGGAGNLIDRLCLGYVTDMFDFRIWPVFNIADIAVCVGAGFLILYTLVFSSRDEKKKRVEGNQA